MLNVVNTYHLGPNTDYKNCYSAKKEEGGEYYLDLSHELDYVQWLAGQINEIKSYQVKFLRFRDKF